MNKSLFFITIHFLFLVDAYGQNCLPGGILLNTQSQIDNFATNYPGCTTVQGNVTVSGTNITNLNGLSQLTRINGSLNFLNVNSITNLTGLNNLTRIGGELGMYSSAMTSISGLSALTYVGGNFHMEYGMNNINGLSNLDTIGLNLISKTTDFTGLKDLKYLGNNADINNSNNVNFTILDTIRGDLIFSNSHFNNSSTFSNLKKISGKLDFITCTGNLVGFNALGTCARIKFSSQTTISSINGFNGLQELKYTPTIAAELTLLSTGSITGFNSLARIKNANFANTNHVFSLSGNPSTDVIIGFENLKRIDGKMNFSGFAPDDIIPSFSNLDSVYLLALNGFSKNISNFNSLDYSYGIDILSGSFNTLSGFNQLAICPFLNISNNIQLNTISGFQNLNTVGSLTINSNSILTDISGFNHSLNVTSLVTIGGNPMLFECSVQGICQAATNNELNVFNNLPGCNTVAQVLLYCPSSDSDNDGIPDNFDNCDNIPNPGQEDANNDGEGNVCDTNSDTDGDGLVDANDNCVSVQNPNQADANNDGQGDACDSNSDTDGDGYFDNVDNCPSIANPNQQDCNANGIGDVCENFMDTDCDGIQNASDNCVTKYNPMQYDLNTNGIGDACEEFPKVGINNNDPKTELHLSYGSLYLDNPEKAIILKGPDNLCYKTVVQIVNNQPTLGLVLIPCPN